MPTPASLLPRPPDPSDADRSPRTQRLIEVWDAAPEGKPETFVVGDVWADVHRWSTPGLAQITEAPAPTSRSEEESVADRLWDAIEAAEQQVGSRVGLVLLRRATELARQAGWDGDPDVLDPVKALDELSWFAQRLTLDEHYELHPDAKPDLVGITLALAAQYHHPLADEPELISRAEHVARRQFTGDVSPRELLFFAAGSLVP